MNTEGLYFTCQVGDLPEETFAVAEFHLQEALSELFTLTLTLVSSKPDIALSEQLLMPASLTVHHAGEEPRKIAGVIASAERGNRGFRRTYYTLTIRPEMWVMTLRQDSRIFHQQSIPQILSTLLRKHRVIFDTSMRDPHSSREYVTQKREKDYDFFVRLAAEEGITFWFECPDDDQPQVYFGDSYIMMPEGPTANYNPHPQNALKGTYISDLRFGAFMTPDRVIHKDYDYKDPFYNYLHEKMDTTSSSDLFTVFDSYGRFPNNEAGKTFAKYRLEALQSGKEVGHATSNSSLLMPGKRFTLAEHPDETLNTLWQVISADHHGVCPQAAEEESEDRGTYLTNKITFISGRQEWRAPYRYKPQADGAETATVVGPSGEEIYTDKNGCVRVHFHWNRYDAADDGASCWVRVANGWNGNGYGMVAIPRIGQEVVITYLNGDIDRPLITGCTYNEANQVPYPLPANKTKMVLRSKTHKGVGFNELSFEDANGSEVLYMHAQKDWLSKVKNDARWDIARDYHKKIERDRITEISRDSHTTITGESRIKIGGDESLKVEGSRHQDIGDAVVMKVGNEVNVTSGSKIILSAGTELTIEAGGNFLRIDPSGIYTSQGLNIGMGAAGSGQALNLREPNQPLPVMAPPPLSPVQLNTLTQPVPYCEECEKCKDGECSIDDSTNSTVGATAPAGVTGGGFAGGLSGSDKVKNTLTAGTTSSAINLPNPATFANGVSGMANITAALGKATQSLQTVANLTQGASGKLPQLLSLGNDILGGIDIPSSLLGKSTAVSSTSPNDLKVTGIAGGTIGSSQREKH